MNLAEQMEQLARQAREASHALAQLATHEKNAALMAMADALEAGIEPLQAANREDLRVGESLGLTKAMMDRLALDPRRIRAMAQGLREVAALPDPVGRILDDRTRPNGLHLRKITVPLGVIVIIYESRPNVTADAASLCLKSGNATILRGGKEALNSNQWIARTMVEAGRRAL
jgi:glutamate-5-semialdehyde dehydrogenase